MRDSQKKSSQLRVLIKWSGTALMLAALIIIGFKLAQTPPEVWSKIATPRIGVAIVLLSVGYGISLFLVFFCWLLLLGSSRKVSFGIADALNVYALFQILKYLPTNVVHQAGRYAILRGHGFSHSVIIWSSTAEAALIVLAALLVAICFGSTTFLPLFSAIIEDGKPFLKSLAILTFLTIPVLYFVRRKIIVQLYRALAGYGKASAISLLIYILFFVLAGLNLHYLAIALLPGASQYVDRGPIIAAGSAAWIVGFLTPGAPGGIGVREFVLLQTLKPIGLASHAAVIAAIFRLITMLGDGVFFLVAKSVARVPTLARRGQ